jgi:hypothetical protein
MALYTAIAAVGTAIVNLLKDASRTEFPQAQFKLLQASDFTANNALPTPEGVSVYLYRVTPSTQRRNLPPRTDQAGLRFRPSMPIDLYFLISPWAANAEKQLRLLGWTMRVLEDTSIIPATLLNELEQDGKIFAPAENVELFFEAISLADMALLWDNLKQVKTMPSVTYVARMVLLDSFTQQKVYDPVQTREITFQENG